ncbi:MAG: FAD-dependent oxidoreductase, partial [Candidatus Hydrogenedentes bacterium]|nr:FAD-dependent oxidoreductase [Candidatus Hydrogenedentota bacterium]
DTIKDNETIRDELLAIMLGVWDHIKNGGDHGADTWALEWFGFLPGKRESRRFLGLHMLCESDVLGSAPFADAIAFGGWPIDTHPVQGVDAPAESPCSQHRVPHVYDIPLRACISRDIPNLLFAGRNISATHIAFASTRVMATAAAMGQGVGTAAAYAARHDVLPAAIPDRPECMRAVQQRLLRDDAYLIGLANEEGGDFARTARLTASSAQAAGPVANLVSGVTRALHGPDGAPPDRVVSGTHRWMSEGLPAQVELRWAEPVHCGEVQLVFDTGLHRPLTLTHSDAYAARMAWGTPQPETVRDYLIEGELDGTWRTLVQVEGNYQRRRVHEIAPGNRLTALRLTVTATNGLDHARVCEVRVYAGSPGAI